MVADDDKLPMYDMTMMLTMNPESSQVYNKLPINVRHDDDNHHKPCITKAVISS